LAFFQRHAVNWKLGIGVRENETEGAMLNTAFCISVCSSKKINLCKLGTFCPALTSFSIVIKIWGEKVDLGREQQQHTKGILRITGPYWAQGNSKYCRRTANAT